MKRLFKRLLMVVVGGLLIAAVLILIVELSGIGRQDDDKGRRGGERGTIPPTGESLRNVPRPD